MGETANAKLCILWEHEIRSAAKALAALKDAPDTEFQDLAIKALNACLVALHHVEDDASVVMIAADTVKGLARSKRSGPTSTSSYKSESEPQ